MLYVNFFEMKKFVNTYGCSYDNSRYRIGGLASAHYDLDAFMLNKNNFARGLPMITLPGSLLGRHI
jgi:hypothetical protein